MSTEKGSIYIYMLPCGCRYLHLHVARAGRVRVLKVRELGGNGNIYLGNGTETGRMYAETDRDGNSGLSPYPYSYLISGRQIDCPGASSPRIWPTEW